MRFSRCSPSRLRVEEQVFIGFIITASLAMTGGVYGTYRSDISVIVGSVIIGLAATAVVWLGFIRDLRREG